MWNKIKPILLTFALIWLIGSCVITKTKADTAISTNILPNAGTTSSNMDNFNLDGVQSGSTGFLNNNSTVSLPVIGNPLTTVVRFPSLSLTALPGSI